MTTVDTQSATLKSVADERRIRELPLNGRDATQLVLLLPGVQTNNFSAESGRSAGAVVNAVAKSGTSSLDTSLFEFHRNGGLNDARATHQLWRG